MNSMNDANIPYIDDRAIPYLMSDLNLKNMQISDLELHIQNNLSSQSQLEDVIFRLRRFITDMQHRYETLTQRRDLEIQNLTGRVLYLEEELFNLSRKPNDNILIKDNYDPQLVEDLRRQLKLKQEELDQVKRLLQDQQEKSQLIQKELLHIERKQIQLDQKKIDLPFVLENDDLKRQLAELRRQYNLLNDEFNQIKTQNQQFEAELKSQQKKIREYEHLDRIRLDNEEEYKRNLKPVYIKVNEDENLLNGVLGLVHYVRESLCDSVFEIFMRSANQAQTKKTNSTIIFTINIKELNEKSVKGLLIVLYLYSKMKQFIKIYFPNYSKLGEIVDQNEKTSGKQSKHLPNNRDSANQWVESNLALCSQQWREKKKDPNREYYHLYRLLAVKYRANYPLQGNKPIKLDEDIRVRLEHKISMSLTRIFIQNQ